jgi:hypothetical protein
MSGGTEVGAMDGASPEDRAEQAATATRDEAVLPAPDVPLEAPDADAVEQAAEVAPVQHVAARDLPLEADDADAAEQATVLDLDEDERR